MKIKIKLCEGCKLDLEEYNPYIDENKKTIPLSNIEVEVVDVENCNNTTFKNPIIIEE